MAGVRGGLPIIAQLITCAVAAFGVLWLAAATPGASQSASVEVIAIDADPSGNAPRSVGAIDECVSAVVGRSVDIDIVVPDPGIPDPGIAAYQLTIFYNPAIVWIEADDPNQLLAQASGSSVLPIADPKPDKDGVYRSWAVDFGGTSETGSGVIAKITLIPQVVGASPLILKDVVIAASASQTIAVDSILSATINVGQSCPGQNSAVAPSPTPTSSPAPPTTSIASAAASATPTPPSSTDPPSPSTDTPLSAQRTPVVAAFSSAGGPPPSGDGDRLWFIAVGLITVLGGASLLAGGTTFYPSLIRRRGCPHEDRTARTSDDDS